MHANGPIFIAGTIETIIGASAGSSVSKDVNLTDAFLPEDFNFWFQLASDIPK